ncbi:MAG: UvrD-helicase domain-containing protein [Acidobacteriota bacterium]
MNWTPAQREAIETRGRRVLVSAGAGSGKTRVLVERFLALLEENIDWRVADIVAVTFTEKAAREMVSRIRREIRSRIERSADATERARWREHRNALDSSRIGTIHALCAAILRAHPAEAGLDPAFEVIEEIEASRLLTEAIDEVLLDTVRSLTAEAEVFSYLTPFQIREVLHSLIAQGERARRAIALFADHTPEDLLRFWQEIINEQRRHAIRNLFHQDLWRNAVNTVMRLAALDASDKREQLRAQVAELLSFIEQSTPEEGIGLLLNIKSTIKLTGGSKNNWASVEEFEAVKEALRIIRTMIENEAIFELCLNELDAQAARVAVHLAKLYTKVRARFAELKDERAVLDFNDLEEITERLLASHQEVRELYKNQGWLRALMVDEFQDTAPIQKNILWMIAPASAELFIIGDAKQSIYRFRGADVTVFQDVRLEFEASDGHIVGMDTCFRTHTRLIDFVNHLFPQVFLQESRYDTPYEAMQAVREAAHDHAAIEIHIIEKDKDAEVKLTTHDLRIVEARLIAERIRQLIDSGDVQVADEQGNPRPVEYGDIALLFQASTNFELYESALADAGIPYVTVAGRGFYARQEITDISNLLAFLANPLDNLSLAAALRSPMFALSDETLFKLRSIDATLWTSLCEDHKDLPTDQQEALRFARETLQNLRSLVGRVSPAQLLTQVVRQTGYLATLMALPHGERRVANVEKLIEQMQALSTLTLVEVVERINELKFREAREGEATIEETGAVKIMTVHKSKGLEFPIVWIVDAAYAGNSDKAIFATHPDLGVAVNLRDEKEIDRKSAPVAAFRLIKRIEAQMERAEKKRLLYVAATRARDHLIISASLGRLNLTGEHWLGLLVSALGIEANEPRGQIEYESGFIDIHWHNAESWIDSEGMNQHKAQSLQKDLTSAAKDSSLQFPLLSRISK